MPLKTVVEKNAIPRYTHNSRLPETSPAVATKTRITDAISKMSLWDTFRGV